MKEHNLTRGRSLRCFYRGVFSAVTVVAEAAVVVAVAAAVVVFDSTRQ